MLRRRVLNSRSQVVEVVMQARFDHVLPPHIFGELAVLELQAMYGEFEEGGGEEERLTRLGIPRRRRLWWRASLM
jgi:hypothetical protein